MLKIARKDTYYLYINGDVKLTRGEVVREEKYNKGTLILYKTNIEGIYKFCYRQDVDTWDAKAGYCWSSRAGVVNKCFGTTLHDACYMKEGDYSYEGCAIDLSYHENMLNQCGYDVDLTPRICKNGDVDYLVKQREVNN